MKDQFEGRGRVHYERSDKVAETQNIPEKNIPFRRAYDASW